MGNRGVRKGWTPEPPTASLRTEGEGVVGESGLSESGETGHEQGEPAGDSVSRPRARGRRLAAAALVGYVGVWCVVAIRAPHDRPLFGASFWELQKTEALVGWLGEQAQAGLLEAGRFAPVGLLAALAMAAAATRRASAAKALAAVVLSVVLATAVRAVERRGVPVAAHLVLPVAGCLLGVWFGRACRRGPRAVLWMVPKLAAVVLALGAGGAALGYAALQDAPLSFEAPAVTSEGKRRVVKAVKSGIRRRPDRPGLRSLRLAEKDIDFLLAWGLSLGSPRRKAAVRLAEGRLTVRGSAGVPLGGRRRYVNVRLAAEARIDDGRPTLSIRELRIGSLPVAGPLAQSVADALLAEVRRDPGLAEALGSVRSLRLKPGAVEVVYREGALDRRTLPSLLERLGAKPEVAAETREYVQFLVAAAPSLPRGEARFGAFLQKAFALAQKRSRAGEAPRENRAAVFALAILMGHSKVEGIVGPVTDSALRRAARRSVGRATLRGRNDWVRHFLVSAAIAVASAEIVSDAAGLLKEELDAAGGSGFSFADLLADRAGTEFALAATDEKTAAAVQQRLAAGFDVDDFFPPAADLPEGIPDRRLQSEYGGVGGPGYRKLEQEIERRLRACAGLR